ncbi:hypothetical protein Goklo_009237 [Gossypium klotzschianum]|uniref:Uncharacterized protein n=1 Tax=Gossypium klotzschianum TaxID=34286 RepID=A0A7J8V392_9ROSI|nr:hypothetical protein [Gossypium klotzschianum]
MAEESSEFQNTQGLVHAPESNEREIIDRSIFDVGDTSMKPERANKEAYSTYSRVEHKPTRKEIWAWYAYELCSYFVHTVLIPVVFSLIIGQIVEEPTEPLLGWSESAKGLACKINEMKLYERLTQRSISVGNSKVSPLEWTSISWAIGLVLAAPALRSISTNLDQGQNLQVFAGAATAIGALFCLPVGFFKVTWIFPIYIAPVVAAIIVATASHTRHHGLMIRGFSGTTIQRHQFPDRRGVSSWLSLYATAAGCLGSAVIAAFVYYMLRIQDIFTGLHHILIFAAVQSTSAGVLHAFGRVLLMDCSPAGKEGAFAVWYSWVKMVGTCLGFAIASGAAAGNVGTSFATAFCTAAVAMVISIYANISDVGGAVAAGLVSEEGETASPITKGLDESDSMSMSMSNVDGNAKKQAVGEEAA